MRFIRGKKGQAAVEYLLTTMALVTVFAGMFGFIQKGLTGRFTKAGVVILSTYPK